MYFQSLNFPTQGIMATYQSFGFVSFSDQFQHVPFSLHRKTEQWPSPLSLKISQLPPTSAVLATYTVGHEMIPVRTENGRVLNQGRSVLVSFQSSPFEFSIAQSMKFCSSLFWTVFFLQGLDVGALPPSELPSLYLSDTVKTRLLKPFHAHYPFPIVLTLWVFPPEKDW